MVCLKQTTSLKFFKGCLSQILLGTFLNTLSHLNSLVNFVRVNCIESSKQNYKNQIGRMNAFLQKLCYRIHKLLTFGNILLESETESSALREIE